jgi:cyclopropane fatty-acyl-phospholipid synthase-like methyltransferase
VDVGSTKLACQFKWAYVHEKFDFTRRWKELDKKYCVNGQLFDVITCFEAIEHMHKDAGLRLLKGARKLLDGEGVFLLSTPIYNGKRMAANHIHEYGVDELAAHVKKAHDQFNFSRTPGQQRAHEAAANTMAAAGSVMRSQGQGRRTAARRNARAAVRSAGQNLLLRALS